MSNNDIDVSIIFVNFKTAKMTKAAIESVISKSCGFSFEIIIVDNSESKEEWDEIERLENDFTKIIDAKSNLGFGKANNLGSSIAKGKYLFFLNTDTLLINNAIYELKTFLDFHSDVGIVGSNLYTIDYKPNHSYVLEVKDLKNEKKNYSFFRLIKNKFKKRRNDFNYTDKPIQINGYVCGAALMIRKNAFNELDGFDKDIFMYAEEALLCYQLIKKLGLKIFNIPSSKIIHFEGGSQNNCPSQQKIKMLIDGNFIYFLKAFGEKDALDFLKINCKISSKMKILYILLLNKEKKNYYINLKNECRKKLLNVK